MEALTFLGETITEHPIEKTLFSQNRKKDDKKTSFVTGKKATRDQPASGSTILSHQTTEDKPKLIEAGIYYNSRTNLI